ncbi:zinc-ribbon-containing protein [Tunisvirus fontaine2]|uniref:Zinc-ribbon-containing protein n=1 Tax=Tunisvirus fontaine2 TaxID=1421067 RepID=V9SGA1_9VIRU|nr:zinc-ribbon-containing protein [Tunisvirus fontaine2]AHC54782.1 zinc-ribbon-containing protein [Tunisvirus fontaine2]
MTCQKQKNEYGLCGFRDCSECFPKSLASTMLSLFWGERNYLFAHEVSKKTQDIFWFEKDEQEFQATIMGVIINFITP